MKKISATTDAPALLPDQGDNDLLHQAAVTVERDASLTAEMTDWDSTVGDGIGRRRTTR